MKNNPSPQKKLQKKMLDAESEHDSDSCEDDEVGEDLPEIGKPLTQFNVQAKNSRTSVSAEAYGKFCKKEEFVPKVVPKTEAQKQRIKQRLNQAFMFNALDEKAKTIVIDQMVEKTYKAGEWVIKQYDNGDNLYVVDEGHLKCFKQFQKNTDPVLVKEYDPGESFGELALLYNAPRAASIQAENKCTLFALDRECFNHIVKDGAMKKRERYEDFLKKVELLSTVDPYERMKVADAIIEYEFKKGSTIIKQGEAGDKFYFLLEGEAKAFKSFEKGGQEKEVMVYKPGSYFGELALLNDKPRQASVVAITDVKLAALERPSFSRLIGPLEDILKRDQEKYKKFV